MHLTLRKALKLRKQLELAIAKVDLPMEVEISVLVAANRETPEAALEAGAKALADRKARQVRLSGILRDLRIAVSRENVAAGVESFLARAADLDRRIALEKAIAESSESLGKEHLQGEIGIVHEALRGGDRSRMYGEPARTVTASVVTSEMRAEARRNLADLRRQREAVEDERVAVNAGRGIEIAEGDAELLREEGFV